MFLFRSSTTGSARAGPAPNSENHDSPSPGRQQRAVVQGWQVCNHTTHSLTLVPESHHPHPMTSNQVQMQDTAVSDLRYDQYKVLIVLAMK